MNQVRKQVMNEFNVIIRTKVQASSILDDNELAPFKEYVPGGKPRIRVGMG